MERDAFGCRTYQGLQYAMYVAIILPFSQKDVSISTSTFYTAWSQNPMKLNALCGMKYCTYPHNSTK